MLTYLVAALLCICDLMHAVLRRVFGPRADLTPSDSLYRRLLPRLSADHPEWERCAWIRATRMAEDTVPVGVDGKTLRGARSAV